MQKNINSFSKKEIIEKLINYNKEKDLIKKNLFWMYTNAILNKNMDEIASQDENITIVDPTNILNAKKKLDFFRSVTIKYAGDMQVKISFLPDFLYKMHSDTIIFT